MRRTFPTPMPSPLPVFSGSGGSGPPPPPAPFMATWFVPAMPVDNNFEARIVFNYAVTGFNRNDLQLRQGDTTTTLTGDRSTLMRETGNTYLLSVTLTGTFDDDYVLRLRANRIEVDGENQPSAHIDSPIFRITTGATPMDTIKLAGRDLMIPGRNSAMPFREEP